MKRTSTLATLMLILICILSGCAQPLKDQQTEPVESVAPAATQVPMLILSPKPTNSLIFHPMPESRVIVGSKSYFTIYERDFRPNIIRKMNAYGSFTYSLQYFEDGVRESVIFGETEDGTNIFGDDDYVYTDVPLLAYIVYLNNENGYTHRLYIVSIFDDSLTLSFDRNLDGIFNTENLEFLDENTVLWEYRVRWDGELVSEIFTVQ